MPWTAKTIHPRYEDLRRAIVAYVLGALDSDFSVRYGRGIREGLTPHQMKLMEEVAGTAAVAAIKGYVRVCKDFRSVSGKRARQSRARR